MPTNVLDELQQLEMDTFEIEDLTEVDADPRVLPEWCSCSTVNCSTSSCNT